MLFTEKEKMIFNLAINHRLSKTNEVNIYTPLLANKNLSNLNKNLLKGIIIEFFKEQCKKERMYSKNDLEIFQMAKEQPDAFEFIVDVEILMNRFLPTKDKDTSNQILFKEAKLLLNLPVKNSYYAMSGNKVYKIGLLLDKKNGVKLKFLNNNSYFPLIKVPVNNWSDNLWKIGANSEIYKLFCDYEKEKKLDEAMEFVKMVLLHNS